MKHFQLTIKLDTDDYEGEILTRIVSELTAGHYSKDIQTVEIREYEMVKYPAHTTEVTSGNATVHYFNKAWKRELRRRKRRK